jgi:hypothetical protein
MKKSMEIPYMQVFKTVAAVVLICLFSTINGQAQEVKGQTVVSTQTVTATVLSVDQKTREVTVKLENGQTHSFIAGDHVKNLAQVKKGDIITAVYTEAIAYEVKQHGSTGAKTTTAVAAAQPGAKPAGAVAQQTTVTVLITAIDPVAPTVTFMGPKGNTETIKVRDPKNLVGVKVGDKVDITYTEALAVTVDEAPKK